MNRSEGRLSGPAGACNFPLGTGTEAARQVFSPRGISPARSRVEMLMPRRDPELPEGTDQIVSGASDDGKTGGGAFVATGGSTRGATDKLVTQVREQVTTLRGQAGDKLRSVADDGKGKATS